MSFENLPDNWTDLPMDTPGLAADAVDLLLKESARDRDALLIIRCDEQSRAFPVAVVVTGVPWRCTAAERRRLLTQCAPRGWPGMVLAVSASHGVPANVTDRWRRSAVRALADQGVKLVAFCSASSFGVELVTGPAREAA